MDDFARIPCQLISAAAPTCKPSAAHVIIRYLQYLQHVFEWPQARHSGGPSVPRPMMRHEPYCCLKPGNPSHARYGSFYLRIFVFAQAAVGARDLGCGAAAGQSLMMQGGRDILSTWLQVFILIVWGWQLLILKFPNLTIIMIWKAGRIADFMRVSHIVAEPVWSRSLLSVLFSLSYSSLIEKLFLHEWNISIYDPASWKPKSHVLSLQTARSIHLIRWRGLDFQNPSGVSKDPDTSIIIPRVDLHS